MDEQVQDGFTTDGETATVTASEPTETVETTPAAVSAQDSVTSETNTDTPVEDRDDKGRYKSSRKDWQARVDKLTWEREEARRELAVARQQASQVQPRQPEPVQQAPAPVQTGARTKPVEDEIGTKYESYAAFAEDLADWKFETRMAEREQQYRAYATQQEQHQVVQTYAAKAQDYGAKAPGFQDRLTAVDDIPLPNVVADVILRSEKGPLIADYLATHREEFAQLAQEWATVPGNAAPVVRRYLESRVAASSGSAPQTRPSTPAPIRPVSGSASVASSTNPDDLDFGPEYIRQMNERERANRRVR